MCFVEIDIFCYHFNTFHIWVSRFVSCCLHINIFFSIFISLSRRSQLVDLFHATNAVVLFISIDKIDMILIFNLIFVVNSFGFDFSVSVSVSISFASAES